MRTMTLRMSVEFALIERLANELEVNDSDTIGVGFDERQRREVFNFARAALGGEEDLLEGVGAEEVFVEAALLSLSAVSAWAGIFRLV